MNVRRLSLALTLLALPVFAAPDPFAEGVRPTPALSPEDEQKSFHLPPGFTIQLVASEPDINKPINLTVDAKGRVWVSSTVEYPWPVKDPNVKPRDSVKVIDVDPATGRATKVTTFADGLNIPAGVYPYKNGVIAFSIPNITYFQDTDGDGVADKRDVLYGPFDTTRDTHGMTNSFVRGFDGFLYATHGFNNRSTITAKDGSSISMDSGTVYRMGLDASHVDKLTVGPVNPFGLMFDSLGQLFVADCHTKPVQSVLRGATYEHFGRPHDGLGYYPKIMGHLHGSTAIGGVITIDDDRWPAEFRNNLLCGNPMTSRVDRDSLVMNGSTQTLKEMPDFVKSDDPWFRPVAFALAPDGSIYMADFYNRIIGHYEVPLTHPGRDRTSGRIWRIVPPPVAQNASADYPPDLSKASVQDLVKTLNHPNITARTLATDQLTDRIGKDAIPVLRTVFTNDAPKQKVHALWALFRLGDLKPADIEWAVKDGNPLIRTHAARILSEMKDLTPEHRTILLALLKDQDALTRRCAADALAMHPAADAVRPLLDLINATDKADAHLIYVARIALRRQLEQPSIIATVPPQGASDADLAAINSVLPAIKTPEAAAIVVKQLQAGRLPGEQTAELIKLAVRFGGDKGTSDAIAYAQQRGTIEAQLEALKALQAGMLDRGGKLEGANHSWAAELVSESLKKKNLNAKQVETLADLAKSLALKDCAAPLAALMADPKADANTRLAAIKAVLALDKSNAPAVAALVGDAAQSVAIREAAGKALSEANTDDARQSLLMPIRTAPQALATKLAVALASRPEGANTLLDAIERNNLSPRLLTEPTVRDKLNAAKIKDLDKRIVALTKNLAPASAQLDKLIAAKFKTYDPKKSDPARGQAVFNKTCAQCHQIAGQGALVGPQLDGIGNRGLDRILEDVIDPNRNVDPNFRFSNVTLKDGDTISGLVRSDTANTLTLVDPTGKEQAIPKKDVDTVEVSKLSLMPTGFGDIIPPNDFNDLLAYLLSNRGGPAVPPAPKAP